MNSYKGIKQRITENANYMEHSGMPDPLLYTIILALDNLNARIKELEKTNEQTNQNND